MGKSVQSDTSTSDVLNEPYKGPSAAVAAAGEAWIAHFGLGLIGLIGGFIGSLLFHVQIGNFLAHRQTRAMELFQSANKDEQAWGKFLLGIFGHGKEKTLTGLVKGDGDARLTALAIEELARSEKGFLYNVSEEIRKIPGVKQLMSLLGTDEKSLKKVDTAIMGGGILGTFGFFIAPVIFWVTGVKHANEGKRQFHRTREEIRTMREQYDALREKYVEAKTQLEEVKINTTPSVAAASGNSPDQPRGVNQPGTVITAASHEASMANQPANAVVT